LRAYEKAQQLASSDEVGTDVWGKLASDDRPVITSNEGTMIVRRMPIFCRISPGVRPASH